MSATIEVGAAVDSYLYEHRDDLTELVCDLVRIDSQIPPYADERRIVAFLRDRMASLGLGSGEVTAAEPERPNLVTRIAGTGGGPTLMLNGHLDTKPVGAALPLWHSNPLVPEIRDGRLYGLGTSDMKSAVAAMVYAAVALRESGTPELAGDLVLAFVADEEGGGALGSEFIAPRLSGIDACLVGEPSGWEHDWQGLHLASRGVCCFRIRVRGTQMHSSLSDRMPSVNASRRMAELLVSIEDELELEFTPHPLGGVEPTLNVGVLVSGGVFFGVVPGLAEFACDLRTLPGMSEASVRASVERWLDTRRARDPELDVDVEFEPRLSWVPPAEIAPDHPLVRARHPHAVPRAERVRRCRECPAGGADLRTHRSGVLPAAGGRSMTALQSVAVNLQKWRLRRGVSVSALARAANVSKSTISELERNNGNPSLETLWALARALEIPLGFLFTDHDGGTGVRVVRQDEGSVAFEQPGYVSRLIAGWEVDGEVEWYFTVMDDGARRDSDSHGAGVIEHALVIDGTVQIGVGDELVDLGPGDLMSFPAGQPHHYRSIDGPARILGMHQYPRGRPRLDADGQPDGDLAA